MGELHCIFIKYSTKRQKYIKHVFWQLYYTILLTQMYSKAKYKTLYASYICNEPHVLLINSAQKTEHYHKKPNMATFFIKLLAQDIIYYLLSRMFKLCTKS